MKIQLVILLAAVYYAFSRNQRQRSNSRIKAACRHRPHLSFCQSRDNLDRRRDIPVAGNQRSGRRKSSRRSRQRSNGAPVRFFTPPSHFTPTTQQTLPTFPHQWSRKVKVERPRSRDFEFPTLAPESEEVTPVPGPSANYVQYCKDHTDEYHHYCHAIHGHRIDLQPQLYKHCALYEQHCGKQEPGPEHAGAFPTIPTEPTEPTEPTTTLQPCEHHCTAPHCTRECKCWYYADDTYNHCVLQPAKGNAFTNFFQSTCQIWWNDCKEFLPVEYQHQLSDKFLPKHAANGGRGRGGGVQGGSGGGGGGSGGGHPADKDIKHYQKPHTQFLQNPKSQHADWLHGEINYGEDVRVPAFGVDVKAADNHVKFPSPADFLGIAPPLPIPIKRKKRFAPFKKIQ